jgi:hypothetical protein
MARSSRDEEFPRASIFDIGQGTLGLEGFGYGRKHLIYALTAPGTRRRNGDLAIWQVQSVSEVSHEHRR